MRAGTCSTDDDVISSVISPGGEPPGVEISVDGLLFEFPAGVTLMEPPQASFESAPYICDGDSLTVTANDFPSTWRSVG